MNPKQEEERENLIQQARIKFQDIVPMAIRAMMVAAYNLGFAHGIEHAREVAVEPTEDTQ
jgi:hypothetical protein